MEQTTEQIHAEELIRSAPSYKKLLNQITTIDDYGFSIKPWLWWREESAEEELKRLNLNQDIYREMIKGGYKFPSEINKARTEEYLRIRHLKGSML